MVYLSDLKKVLVTGAGGIGGVNFVRALRASPERFFIVGTDFNRFHLQFPDLDMRINSPRHSDPSFIDLIIDLIRKNKIDFLHPQPSVEAEVISRERDSIMAKTFLPEERIIARDKLETHYMLNDKGIPVAETRSSEDIDSAYDSLGGGKVWVRVKRGAGGMLSLLCNNADDVKHWIELWVRQGKATEDDFIMHEYLPGRNIAWDSIWYDGKLIASFSRERLEYPFKHIVPSGITGTPTVSKTVVDEEVNSIGERSIRALDPKPHGSYAIDLKDDADGRPRVTEVDSGKFHTTTPLWGFISAKLLKLEPSKNLPYLYLLLGLGLSDPVIHGHDIYPEGLYLLRHIDCGAWLWKEDGSKTRVL